MTWWSLAALVVGVLVGADRAGASWATGRGDPQSALAVAALAILVAASVAVLGIGTAMVRGARPSLLVGVRAFRLGLARSTRLEKADARAPDPGGSAKQIPRAALLCFLVALGSARVAIAWPADDMRDTSIFGRDRTVLLTGVIAAAPWDGGRSGSARLIVDRVGVDGLPRDGRVALTLREGERAPPPGRCFRVAARLRPLRGLANPDLPDPTMAWRAAGIALFGRAKAPVVLAPCTPPPAWAARVRGWAFGWHVRLAREVVAALPARLSSFVLGAALGERGAVPDDVERGFRAAGTTHVLSVSGLHLAALLALAFTGCRRLLAAVPRLPLWISPARWAAWVGLVVVVGFTLVSGEAIATVRSAIMAAAVLGAHLVNRRANLARSVGAAVVSVWVVAPLCLLDVSLQLSLLSVVALALTPRGAPAKRGHRVSHDEVWWRRGLKSFAFKVLSLAGVSLAAMWGTTPVVASVFGDFAPWGVLGNLVLVPLVELWVVPLALAGAAASCVTTTCGHAMLKVAGWGASWAMTTGELFARRAPIWHLPSPAGLPTALFTFVALAFLASLTWAVEESRAGRAWVRPRGAALAAGLALLLLAACALAQRGFRAGLGERDARVTFLDVGQGDAAVIEEPGGHVLVIDGGGNEDGTFDPGELVVAPYLRRRGLRAVDLVILSHPHPDHMNGLFAVLTRFHVHALWTSGDDGKNPGYAKLLELARANGVSLPLPEVAWVGAALLEPRGPWLGDHIGPPEGVSVNDASLVVRWTFGGRRILWAGDVEAQGEDELVGNAAAGWAVQADVLKVPHHGSRTSSGEAFLEAVAPSLAVASLGFDNRFGFPHSEIAARYAERDLPFLRTDRDGAVQLTFDPRGNLSLSCVRDNAACAALAHALPGKLGPLTSSPADGAPCSDSDPRRPSSCASSR